MRRRCTLPRFTDTLTAVDLKVSMDGRGRGRDSVLTERLWRSQKDARVALPAFETGAEARVGIGTRLSSHNPARPRSGPGGRTPRVARGGEARVELAASRPSTGTRGVFPVEPRRGASRRSAGWRLTRRVIFHVAP